MKFLDTDVWGFNHAIKGMRNPMNSWDKSDSEEYAVPFKTNYPKEYKHIHKIGVDLGENDLNLMQRLIKAGPEHRKFMRQIFVSVDITAPLYWWKEFDKYQIGVTTNSCSTMHKLASKPITIEDFEMDDYNEEIIEHLNDPFTITIQGLILFLEELRLKYLETKDKRYWKELVRWLPSSYLQMRTVTMNYENLYSIVRQRAGHRLIEWKDFIEWAHNLPYANELIFYEY